MRKDIINWDEYFMGIALLSAKRSKDPKKQVGACIVSCDKKILSVGYNGFPCNIKDTDEKWNDEATEENPKMKKDYYVVHSELNAILNYKGESLRNSILYVTLFPCNECAKSIIQVGIKKVVYLQKKENHLSTQIAEDMFAEAGIEVQKYIPSNKNIILCV